MSIRKFGNKIFVEKFLKINERISFDDHIGFNVNLKGHTPVFKDESWSYEETHIKIL